MYLKDAFLKSELATNTVKEIIRKPYIAISSRSFSKRDCRMLSSDPDSISQ